MNINIIKSKSNETLTAISSTTIRPYEANFKPHKIIHKSTITVSPTPQYIFQNNSDLIFTYVLIF